MKIEFKFIGLSEIATNYFFSVEFEFGVLVVVFKKKLLFHSYYRCFEEEGLLSYIDSGVTAGIIIFD